MKSKSVANNIDMRLLLLQKCTLCHYIGYLSFTSVSFVRRMNFPNVIHCYLRIVVQFSKVFRSFAIFLVQFVAFLYSLFESILLAFLYKLKLHFSQSADDEKRKLESISCFKKEYFSQIQYLPHNSHCNRAINRIWIAFFSFSSLPLPFVGRARIAYKHRGIMAKW